MRLKYLSLNIWQGGNFFDEIVALVRREDPDVIALQEVYDGKNPSYERKYRSMEELRRMLGYPHDDFAAAYLDNKDFGSMEQGNAVFSKFPLSDRRVVFYDCPYRTDYVEVIENFPWCPRNLQRVTVQTPSGPLFVFNTHGIWGVDGEDNERRLAMADVIVAEVRDKRPAVLSGDLNIKEGTKTVQKIEERMRSIFKGELVTTFDLRVKPRGVGFDDAVVDHLFVSPDVRVIMHSAGDHLKVSDHLPLCATFEF